MTDISDVLHEVLELTQPQLVLDTSALVADPDGVFGAYGERDLVVPLAVLEELDGLKKRLDPVGRAAREVLRTIERLRLCSGGDLTRPVSLETGGTLRVALNGVDVGRLREHGLDEDKADNRIIGVALGLADRSPSVTVVSADAAVRLKAATFGLDAIDHAVAAIHAPRPAGWSEHQVPGGVIDSLYADGGQSEPAAAEIAEALPTNTFAVLQSGSQSVLVRRRRGGLEPLGADVEAWGLRARNKEQRFAMALLVDPSVPVVALDGRAGTGKTLCAVAAGLEQVVEQRRYSRLCVYRPVIPVGKAELGYLPGALDEKIDPWMAAIIDAISALTERRSPEDARQVIDAIKASGQLVMESVAHLRGRTLHNSFVIVDEAQNLPPDVIKTILTRLGEGSKVVFTGDTSQIDAPYLSEHNNAVSVLIDAFEGERCFGHVRLSHCERSEVASLAALRL